MTEPRKALGTHDIAKICQVTPPTVARWIEEGKLPSYTTGGGHRRVWDSDLAVFLKKHNIPIPPEIALAGRERVLIVDDEASVRRLVARIIKKSRPSAEVHEAASGFEAGHKIISLMPSLIVLDIQLPGIDGLKVCQMIRNDSKLKGIRVLAISGHNVEETRRDILKAGADDFLPKPFTPDEFASRLAALVP